MNLHIPSRFAHATGWRIYAAGVLVCAGLSAAAYFFGVEPALAQREASAVSAAELDARRQRATDLAESLGSIRRTLAQTTREVEALPLRLEPAGNINHRLARIADLADELGLGLDEVQPDVPVDGSHYQTVPIRIGGSGTYPACADFLHRLRTHFPDVSVRSFEITNPQPSREHPTATFRVELVWYTAPVKK